MNRSSHDTRGSIGSRQRTIHQLLIRGARRHPQGRNVVEQPRGARLDATMGGFAPPWNVNYPFWYLTFHSRSSRGEARAEQRLAAGGRRLPRPGRVASEQRRSAPPTRTREERRTPSAPPTRTRY